MTMENDLTNHVWSLEKLKIEKQLPHYKKNIRTIPKEENEETLKGFEESTEFGNLYWNEFLPERISIGTIFYWDEF
jgi:hypothetical protein